MLLKPPNLTGKKLKKPKVAVLSRMNSTDGTVVQLTKQFPRSTRLKSITGTFLAASAWQVLAHVGILFLCALLEPFVKIGYCSCSEDFY